ncbi:MAG: hypothetical protein KC636_38420, partial [Myxococcales bacterium]|nr:hypothetical protein [Myxococcales bacterium]
ESARFDSMLGDDRWLGAGVTRFDHRWSAAELAGVRGRIDGKIGMPTLEPLVTLLVGGPTAPAEPAFRAQLRGRGLVILADEAAVWDARARMVTAQALAARWLGGRVRVRLDPSADANSELWFNGGATRYIARETLMELGLSTDEDYLDELNRIELELATSPLRERSLDELVALIGAGEAFDADPRARQLGADASALLVARGAAFMAWIDEVIRETAQQWGGDGVDEVLRISIAYAISKGAREIPVADLLGQAANAIDRKAPPEAKIGDAFQASVIEGRRPALGGDAYGPCFRARARKLQRFELGFVETTAAGSAQPSFTALDPDGPAAKAGLRADDELVDARYVAGDAQTPVELLVKRGDALVELRYQPAGPRLRGIVWERDTSVSDLECELF